VTIAQYAASKGGMELLTKTTALELADKEYSLSRFSMFDGIWFIFFVPSPFDREI
jgi:hypothetical protein